MSTFQSFILQYFNLPPSFNLTVFQSHSISTSVSVDHNVSLSFTVCQPHSVYQPYRVCQPHYLSNSNCQPQDCQPQCLSASLPFNLIVSASYCQTSVSVNLFRSKSQWRSTSVYQSHSVIKHQCHSISVLINLCHSTSVSQLKCLSTPFCQSYRVCQTHSIIQPHRVNHTVSTSQGLSTSVFVNLTVSFIITLCPSY